MLQILVYSDSLTWGIVPGSRKRLPFVKRWPGVLEKVLGELVEEPVRVVENCLNGRRTAWDDPYKPGRNGLEGIEQVIEMHSPLDLVILMLGTNDFQSMHPHNAWQSAEGIRALISRIRIAPIEPGMLIPPILVVSPPMIREPKGPIAPKFEGGDRKSIGLGESIRVVCEEMGVEFMDAELVTRSSVVDGIHLDEDQHLLLGTAISKEATRVLK